MSAVLDRTGGRLRRGWYRLGPGGRTMLVGSLMLALGGGALFMGSAGRIAIGAAGGVVAIIIALTSRDLTLSLVVVWLALLGFVRRLLIPFAGWSDNDPLLLLAPVIAIVLLVSSRREAPAPRTMLSSVALFLGMWTVAQVFNPSEDSVVTAVKAAMFWVVPLLWFFVGRKITPAQHDRVLTTMFWILVPVVGHGLYQTFFKLLPFEYTWVGVADLGESIFLPGFKIRPFSTLVSPQEYGIFVGFGLCVVLGRLLHGHGNRLLTGGLLAVSLVALFLQGSRSVFLFLVLALFVMTFLHLRSMVATLGILSVLFIILYGAIMTSPPRAPEALDDESAKGKSTVSLLVNRQLTGLLDPGGESSTGSLHLELVIEGFRDGLENPLGRGISADSVAAAKEGERETSAESDIAHVTAVFGPIAGLAYVGFIVLALSAAIALHRRDPSLRHLVWVGILIAGLNQWWSGTLYSTSTILFLVCGGVATETAFAVLRAHAPHRVRQIWTDPARGAHRVPA